MNALHSNQLVMVRAALAVMFTLMYKAFVSFLFSATPAHLSYVHLWPTRFLSKIVSAIYIVCHGVASLSLSALPTLYCMLAIHSASLGGGSGGGV